MKKSYLLLPCLAIVSMGFFAFTSGNSGNGEFKAFTQSHFSAGGQSGLTGAPGESNCTNCHSGSTQNGDTENSFVLLNASFQPVTLYTPGASYTASIQLNSNPDKKGFSAVALTPGNTNAGTTTGSGIGGTQHFAAGGRTYVSHTSTSNTSSTAVWAWTWVAPATNIGNVTFYVASNVANNNSQNTGDVIYLSQHIIGSTAGIEESTNETSFTAGYSATSNKLMLDFKYLASGDMHLNVVDMNGRSVFVSNLGQSEIGENSEVVALPAGIENGIYVVHFFVGNKAMSAKIMVNK